MVEAVVPEWRIENTAMTAVISAAAGAVRELKYLDKPLLESFPRGSNPDSVNILLTPWPNRIRRGRFHFDGRDHELAITEPTRGNALHGFAIDTLFSPQWVRPDSLQLGAVLGPRQGWPWPIRATVQYWLNRRSLKAQCTLTNMSDSVSPLSFGVHTYLNAQGEDLEKTVLEANLDRNLPLDPETMTPCAPDQPADRVVPEFPGSALMNGRVLDHAFLDNRLGNHEHVYRLISTATGSGVELRACSEMRWAQIYTSPQRTVAVEPMTAPPGSLTLDRDVHKLGPGHSATFSWSVGAIEPDG